MSLTIIERRNTKKELAANFNLAGVTLEQAAQDLATTPEHVEAVLQLQVDQIEEPWILRNYLNKQLAAQGENATTLQPPTRRSSRTLVFKY